MKATITSETVITNVTRITLESEGVLHLSVSRGRGGYLIRTGVEHRIIPYSQHAFEIVPLVAVHPFMESSESSEQKRSEFNWNE